MIKSLEALETVKKLASAYAGDKYAETLTEDIEKELKALEIIKKCRIKLEKREDFDVVSYATFRKNGKYRYYINDIEITQEKYNLLREVLEK